MAPLLLVYGISDPRKQNSLKTKGTNMVGASHTHESHTYTQKNTRLWTDVY